jgi:hypothetical protein
MGFRFTFPNIIAIATTTTTTTTMPTMKTTTTMTVTVTAITKICSWHVVTTDVRLEHSPSVE